MFFSGKNPFFQFTGQVLDVVVLSFLWLLCALPLITIGPATAALYYSCVKCLRFHEPEPYRNFFRAFRENLHTGLAASVLWICVVVILGAGDFYLHFIVLGTESRAWELAWVVYRILLLLPAAMLTVSFPLLSRFSCSAQALFSTSFQLTFRHMPRMLLAGIINGVMALLTIWGWYFWLMLLLPAIDMLLISFLYEPVFRKYTPETEIPEDGERPWYLKTKEDLEEKEE